MSELEYDGSYCGIRSVNEYTRSAHTADASADFTGKKIRGKNQTGYLGHYEATADAEAGVGGAIAGAGAASTVYKLRERDGEVNVGKSYTHAEVGAGLGGYKAKAELGVDVVNARGKLGRNQEVSANLGFNVDTGVEAGVDGISVKAAGLGFSVGRNMGISTPFGGINFKLW